MKNMKKLTFLLPVFFISLTCAQFPILSDLYNNRITVILKGTYESNTPYGWNANLYQDDTLAAPYSGAIVAAVPQSNISLYLDISEIRFGTGTGKPANVAPEQYWVYFTPKREVFCSNNYANGDINYKILSCVKDNGDQHYADLFSNGFTYPAVDVPEKTYKHLAIFFRKLLAGPATAYSDNASSNPSNLSTTFDNRYLNGINLMDSITQYSSSDTSKTAPLMFPLQRTDLSLTIPPGRDPYVLEIRMFLKNLLMKHVIKYTGGSLSAGPLTFVGPSDWNSNHVSNDPNLAYQMGGNVIFTARIYDPANVGSIAITDTWAPAYSAAFFVAVPAGSTYNPNDIPYAATSVTSGAGGTISNLPPGSYDIYKTGDKFQKSTNDTNIAGQDGFPETVSLKCATVTVTAGTAANTTTTGCVSP